jgi:hypothetical protein
MNPRFKDREHYLRAALLFGAGVALFLFARGFFVPRDFGLYGHFRPGALADNRSRPVAFAGMKACEECHDDVVKTREGSKHRQVHCEACHGALAAHAQDPSAVTPVPPEAKTLCLVCHLANSARPASFPQIDPVEHAGADPCLSCHGPHHPEPE